MRLQTLLLIPLAMSLFQCSEEVTPQVSTLYVGTYTDTESEGIYRLRFDTDEGKIISSELAAEITNPSYLALTSDKNYLYAVQEVNDYEDGAGAITAFALENDRLNQLQTVSSMGAHPCHVALSPAGNKLAVSNYSGGNASIYNLSDQGRLTGAPRVIDHTKIDSTKTAHAHMAQWVNDDIYIADLGLDAVHAYADITEYDAPKASLQLPDGAGPRHFTTAQNGAFMYVINELNSSITVFEKEAAGGYREIQNESTLATDFEGKSYCADIHISEDGKYLYGSNRGENTIVIFSIAEETGKLTLVGREGVRGDWPRNFTFDPTEKFLLVANQNSNNITVFKRDSEKGTLSFLNEYSLSKPVCLVFL